MERMVGRGCGVVGMARLTLLASAGVRADGRGVEAERLHGVQRRHARAQRGQARIRCDQRSIHLRQGPAAAAPPAEQERRAGREAGGVERAAQAGARPRCPRIQRVDQRFGRGAVVLRLRQRRLGVEGEAQDAPVVAAGVRFAARQQHRLRSGRSGVGGEERQAGDNLDVRSIEPGPPRPRAVLGGHRQHRRLRRAVRQGVEQVGFVRSAEQRRAHPEMPARRFRQRRVPGRQQHGQAALHGAARGEDLAPKPHQGGRRQRPGSGGRAGGGASPPRVPAGAATRRRPSPGRRRCARPRPPGASAGRAARRPQRRSRRGGRRAGAPAGAGRAWREGVMRCGAAIDAGAARAKPRGPPPLSPPRTGPTPDRPCPPSRPSPRSSRWSTRAASSPTA